MMYIYFHIILNQKLKSNNVFIKEEISSWEKIPIVCSFTILSLNFRRNIFNYTNEKYNKRNQTLFQKLMNNCLLMCYLKMMLYLFLVVWNKFQSKAIISKWKIQIHKMRNTNCQCEKVTIKHYLIIQKIRFSNLNIVQSKWKSLSSNDSMFTAKGRIYFVKWYGMFALGN